MGDSGCRSGSVRSAGRSARYTVTQPRLLGAADGRPDVRSAGPASEKQAVLRDDVINGRSLDPATTQAVCATRGARYLGRAASGGHAAARNTGLARVDSELFLFLDRDCAPPADLADRVAGHNADPLVGAVAPRITAL
ncbi:MAG: glycosyltransferase [Frankia sp.]